MAKIICTHDEACLISAMLDAGEVNFYRDTAKHFQEYNIPLKLQVIYELTDDPPDRKPNTKTFGDIYNEFCKEHPGFAKLIDDYRPIGPSKLQFWLKNGEIWHYDDFSCSLKRGENEYPKK